MFRTLPYEWYWIYGLPDPTVPSTPFLDFETYSTIIPKGYPLLEFPKPGPSVYKKSSPVYTLPDDPGGD
jgi:hypothetical protein